MGGDVDRRELLERRDGVDLVARQPPRPRHLVDEVLVERLDPALGGGALAYWFGGRFSSFAVIIMAEVWKTTPFMALLLLAGLVTIDSQLYEAAKVDGATAWQRFTRITLPLMKPAILVALLFRTLDAFRVFDTIYIMTAGAQDTESVSILGFNQLISRLNLGLGSAVSVLIFLCVFLIAFVFVKGFGAKVQEGRPGG